MHKTFFAIGSISGALSVVLGAFAAHALKAKLSPDQLHTFETGVRYQMYHTLALVLACVILKNSSNYLTYSAISFIAGIVLFSGSLYLLSMRDLLGIQTWSFLGPITPLGGLCFISGWIFLFIASLKQTI